MPGDHADKNKSRADKRTGEGNSGRNLERTPRLASADLEDNQSKIDDGKDRQQQQNRGSGKFADVAK